MQEGLGRCKSAQLPATRRRRDTGERSKQGLEDSTHLYLGSQNTNIVKDHLSCTDTYMHV